MLLVNTNEKLYKFEILDTIKIEETLENDFFTTVSINSPHITSNPVKTFKINVDLKIDENENFEFIRDRLYMEHNLVFIYNNIIYNAEHFFVENFIFESDYTVNINGTSQYLNIFNIADYKNYNLDEKISKYIKNKIRIEKINRLI